LNLSWKGENHDKYLSKNTCTLEYFSLHLIIAFAVKMYLKKGALFGESDNRSP